MYMFTDETEFDSEDVHVFQRVVSMFDRNPQMQRILRHSLGLQYDYEMGFPGEDQYSSWVRHHNNYQAYQRFDRSTDRGNQLRSSSSVYPSWPYYASSNDLSSLSSMKVQAKENDTERKTRLLQETKKSKEKAEKKKKKKLRQKKRKQREKLEREKRNAEKKEGKESAAQCEEDETKPVDDEATASSSNKLEAQAEDTESSDSSDSESSDDDSKYDSCASEELDMASSFVSKAALIAQRKMEQKPRPVKMEKKKVADKKPLKTVPDQADEAQEAGKKDSASANDATPEDYAKISTNFAVIGNEFASSGEFQKAVKFYTDAIKYNPLEFKLFGNRSFCFEKLQEYDKALCDANLSLSICPGWVKGLFRKGRALAGLKRYEEAAQAFRDVLKLDSSYAEAAQELMRVQITQLMECGYTREQSSNALIIHGTVEKSLEVLSKLNRGTGLVQNGTLPSVQVANVTGLSPVLSANTNSKPLSPRPTPPPTSASVQAQDAPKKPPTYKPLGPVQNTPSAKNQPLELFPVWVGNLNSTITESMITNLFNKVGPVYSAKVLVLKRCAFVNFTKQECCEAAIRRFNGYELNEVKLAVRYPDRTPPGMGISRSALIAKPPAK